MSIDHNNLTGLDSLNQALADPSFQHALQRTQWDVPGDIAAWLARAALLYGLPFPYLIPDARMLPPERLRFFYVDANWLDALMDGITSVGTHTKRDALLQKILQPVLRGAAQSAALKWRSNVRDGKTFAVIQPHPGDDTGLPEQVAPDLNWCGFLLRSAVVAGWPGLEVNCYRGSEEDSGEMDVLRLERLAPDLLFCLLPAVPGLITLNEPAEGLHFGMSGSSEDGAPVVMLRSPDGISVASLDDPRLSPEVLSPEVKVPFRDSERCVIDIAGLRDTLQAELKKAFPALEIGPANFAVQLLDSAKKQSFLPHTE